MGKSRFPETEAVGFTLIEVLIALTILGLVLSFVLPVFSIGISSAGRNEAAMMSMNEVQSILATVGSEIAVVSGDVSGVLPDAHGWHVEIRPNHQLPDDSKAPSAAYDVVVTVAWSEGTRQRLTSLHTIRLGRRGATQ